MSLAVVIASMSDYANGKLPASALAPIHAGQLALEPAAGWNAMNAEARAQGCELVPSEYDCSYRDYDAQVYYWNLYQSGQGNLAAKPGTSNHGWGTAVDLDTEAMRSMVDRIGAKYGWSKAWSDAPTEWWHIVYQSGHYSGPDPGPEGNSLPTPPEDTVSIFAVVKQDGRLEVFAQKSDGTVMHAYQVAKDGGWAGSDKGKAATWYSLGNPGK